MSQSPQLIIHDASAGSGKTFTLVKNYMEICLNPEHPIDIYTKILAITFTNKAAKEMKDRIVEQLEDFAGETTKSQFLLDEFADKYNVTILFLKKRSFNVLQHILHNFSQFSVSTIDKFMLKIVRSIQYEIGLKDSFELILDYEEWFDESIAEVIDDVEKNKDVEQFLFNYIQNQIVEDKTWNLENEIAQIAQTILREDYVKHISSVIKINSFDDLKSIENDLKEKHKELDNVLTLIHSEYLELVKTNDLKKTDFSRSNCILFNIFSHPDLSGVKKQIQLVKLSALAKKMNTASFFTKSNLSKPHIEQAQGHLELFIDKYKMPIFQVYFHSILLKKIENQVKNLHFEFLLHDKLNGYLDRNHVLPIGALNGILDEFIQTDEIPMLLMKMGERFEFIFIDEFQDTSDTQWSNLYPFIENILSKGYQVHLIGDAKQSIYRFRGGDVDILLDLKKNRKRAFYEIIDAPPLTSNWRSGQHIVEFNNRVFSELVQGDLSKDSFKTIYETASQDVKVDKDSYVEIFSTIASKDDKLDIETRAIKHRIDDVIQRGFTLGDICILCRGADEINKIADYLLSEDIPFVNDDSLLVFSDHQVQFLWDVLCFQVDSENEILKSKILGYLFTNILMKTASFTDWYLDHNKLSIHDIMKKEGFVFPNQIEQNYFEFLEIIIHELGFNKNIYTLQFLELCHKQISKGLTQIQQFIKLGEKNKSKWKVQLQETKDTVKILTVHKSKGLEYPVVLLPFLTKWSVFSTYDKQWYPTSSIFKDIPFIKSSFSDDVLNELPCEINGFIKDIKNEFEANMYFDFINLFYVACTRAAQELYLINVFTPSKSAKDYSVNKKSLSDFVLSYFVPQTHWNSDFITSFGVKVDSNKHVKRKDCDDQYILENTLEVGNWNEKVKIAQNEDYNWIFDDQISAQQRGNHIHNILALINTHSDLDRALSMYFSKRWIPKTERLAWEESINGIIHHEQLTNYFSNEVIVWNERDWFSNNGETLRPDRVVSFNNQDLIVIDYKTGKINEAHKKQVDEYGRQLSFSDKYNVVKKILVYTEELKIVSWE